MPSNLSVMVLYTNDAVDILYTDKSVLQLAPCGTGFIHHASPQAGIHPLSGMRSIQQLSRYPTSEFQDKVTEALDFRNRFAEEPYLCSDSQTTDEIICQYADIKQLAWPKELDSRSCDYFEDGSVRVNSVDQYGSLVLSGHQQDFTVCYLSAVSQDHIKTTLPASKTGANYKNKEKGQTLENTKNDRQEIADISPENSVITENLSISPISRTSNDSQSPPAETKQDKSEFRRFSTPTREFDLNEEPVITPYGKTAVLKNTSKDSDQNISEEAPMSQRQKVVPESKDSSGLFDSQRYAEEGTSVEELQTQHRYMWVTKHYSSLQHPVCWNHPVTLAKQAIQSQEKTHNGPSVMRRSLRSTNFPVKIDHGKCVMTTIPTPIPLTCPGKLLHKTQLQQIPDHSADLLSWRRGKLKIILIDGVVYRIVRLPSMKVMEIYPGDGSVIVSQGLSGHIFSHSSLSGNKLEEKTYSAKTPIPAGASKTVTIQKLINRGYRFLCHANQEDALSSAYDVCCWKYEAMPLKKPGKSVLLEETSVPGHGRFSAYSDGRVRILFADRTSLDMVADFSNHISVNNNTLEGQILQQTENRQDLCRLFLPNGKYCMVDTRQPGQFSKYVEAAQEWVAWVNSTPLERRTFYQQEEYKISNQISAEKELEKINCFNYILDNTAFSTSQKVTSRECSTGSNYQDHNEGHSSARISAHVNNQTSNKTMSKKMDPHCSRTVSKLTNHMTKLSDTNMGSHSGDQCRGPVRSQLTENSARTMMANQNNSNIDWGFTSVRNALLQTSKCLDDIDSILSRRT